MEMQFHKTLYPCLQRVKWEVQNGEQTQELRLNDGMPDIGRVLGAWGQVLLRSKEWRGGTMQVSGGVMVWVLYNPEDGSEPRCMESWIPFQLNWELPDTGRDGNVRAVCLLRNVDARSLSARKLMVRVNVGCLAEATVPGELCLHRPENLPEEVQLLKNTYPVQLPKEAGEKPFVIDGEFTDPGMQKVLYYTLQPEITEQKVLAGRVVFRGNARLHTLCRDGDGKLYSRDHELPFSQFAELEGEYSTEAEARVTPAVTSLELDVLPEGQLHLKAGLTGQYVISDRELLETVEDAYCPKRPVTLQKEQLLLPAELDHCRQKVHCQVTAPAEGSVVDAVFYPDHGRTMSLDEGAEIALTGQFQLLSYDAEDRLESANLRWEGEWTLPADRDTQVLSLVDYPTPVLSAVSEGAALLQTELQLSALTVAKQGLDVVTGLTLGEETDAERPSLILRKRGQDSLWELAKRCGSTVDAITRANDLEEQPDADRILLIPVV